MKQRISFLLTIATALIAVSLVIVSCNKKFDAPPYNAIPNITANTTIAALKALHSVPGSINQITDTSVIAGVVIANDKSGNLYKEIFIADASGGIELMLGGSNLYTSYPVGMQVFIKCQGLALSDYNGDMELGFATNINGSTSITSIPSALFGTYIVPGTLDNPVPVKTVTLTELANASIIASTNPALDTLQNTLVQIIDAQFADTTGLLYSDTSSTKGNVSRTVSECASASTTVIYTSGYANFAGVTLPKGNGSIAAVYVPYKGTSELLVRDTSDIKFTGTRCNGGSGGGTDLRISALRALYTGTNIKPLPAYTVHGVVISDASNGNISKGNVVIQDGNSGITVYFGSATINYNVGDSIIINTVGGQLQSYMGSLELDPVGTAPSPVATGKVITPNVITTAQLSSNISTLENTLVEIKNATTAGGTYSGSKTLTDASGSMTLYTLAAASFASSSLPATASNFIGYATAYNTTSELHLRNAADVTGGSGGGGTSPVKTIAQIRAMLTNPSTPVTLPACTITGVVISDVTDANISKGNVVIQDGTAGISLYFGSVTITYHVGDSIVLDVTGAKLQSYLGALEVDPTSSTLPAPVATGVTIIPQVVTIAQVNSGIANLEYTLITIDNATASGGTTYSGSKTLTDASGNFILYTLSAASFSGTTLPTGSHNWTGYPHSYNSSVEFSLRNTGDVQ